MNRFAALVAFVATIVATLALTSTSASAGKPPPTTPDPCVGAQLRGFPALAFTRKRTTGGRIYYDRILSDLAGQCQQTVFVSDAFAPSSVGPDQLRFDKTTGKGLMVGSGTGYVYFAFPFDVSFSVTGVPTVTPNPLSYSQILALSDFATPADLASQGWSNYVMANPTISPDGTKLMTLVAFQKTVGGVQTQMKTYWTCPFSVVSPQTPIVASSCAEVFRGNSGEYPNANWGGQGSDSLYVIKAMGGTSATALFRLQLTTQTLTQLWNLGTAFFDSRGGLDVYGNELVAVYEGAPTNGCTKVLVTNPATCDGNGCTPLNGGGAPARTLTWLPNGLLAGEGRTAPDRKGNCSPSGSVVTFDPYAVLPTTTIVPVGSSPAGAGGG